MVLLFRVERHKGFVVEVVFPGLLDWEMEMAQKLILECFSEEAVLSSP